MLRLVIIVALSASAVTAGMWGEEGSAEVYGLQNSIDTLDKELETCLSTKYKGKGIDFIIDVTSFNPFQQFPFYYPGFNFNPVNKAVSCFVEAVSQAIPQCSLTAIIIDGKCGNQTRYYLSMANVSSLPATTTQTPPFFFRGRPFYYGWQPVNHTIGVVLRSYLDTRANGGQIQLPTSRPSSSPSPLFTVVITDGSQGTQVANYSVVDKTAILDVGGSLASTSKGYTTRNLIVAPINFPLDAFIRTFRLKICQVAGGIS